MRLVLLMALLAVVLSGCGRSDGDNLKTINALQTRFDTLRKLPSIF